MPQAGQLGRSYAGRDRRSRQAHRRSRLLEAAFDLFGSPKGPGTATVERICTQAGVATRAIYEEFGGRDELLEAVYEAVARDTENAMDSALDQSGDHMRKTIAAYVGFLTEDPRRARIAHLAPKGNGPSDPQRTTTSLLVERVGSQRGPLTTIGMVGAVDAVMSYWAQAQPPPATNQVVDELVHTCTSLTVSPSREERAS